MTWASIHRRPEYALLCILMYRFRKHMQKVKARPRIPALPDELWIYMAMHSCVQVRAVVRGLTTRTKNIELRRPFPHLCHLCGQEPLMPVKLRFEWQDDASLNNAGFCRRSPFFCLRCARAWVQAGMSQSCLVCTEGCCKAPLQTRYRLSCAKSRDSAEYVYFNPYMGYGDWPRTGAAMAHSKQYYQLEKRGIGKLTCNICNYKTPWYPDFIWHMRTDCQNPPEERDRLYRLALSQQAH